MSSDAILKFAIRMGAGGEPVNVQVALPEGPLRPKEMLRVFQALADVFVSAGETEAKRQGRTVSCRAGCGACCRQVVPITPAEAWWLAEYVASLPAERRAAIATRFAEARRRLEEAGLYGELSHPERLTETRIASLGRTYFGLGLACPFLENEACSIHPVRPLSCREFLVSSPPAYCATPEGGHVERVHVPLKVSTALGLLGSGGATNIRPWVPLILALEWANSHEDPSAPRPAPDILRELLEHLDGRQQGAPP